MKNADEEDSAWEHLVKIGEGEGLPNGEGDSFLLGFRLGEKFAASILEEKKLLVSSLQSHIHELKCMKKFIFVGANVMSRDEEVKRKAVATIKHYESVTNNINKCETLIERLKL